jgi:hypothetical protein
LQEKKVALEGLMPSKKFIRRIEKISLKEKTQRKVRGH